MLWVSDRIAVARNLSEASVGFVVSGLALSGRKYYERLLLLNFDELAARIAWESAIQAQESITSSGRCEILVSATFLESD